MLTEGCPAEIYPIEMKLLLSNGAILFDVSEENQSREAGDKFHLEHVPLSRITELKNKLDREKPAIFCCRSGLLSYQAAKIATQWTTQPVYYLPGGLLSVTDG